MPDGLRDRIKDAAKNSRRSTNAEIILHLERIFPAPVAATEPKAS
ncbi:Arc family DNA-binding protein [Azorhizobium caulinodans]